MWLLLYIENKPIFDIEDKKMKRIEKFLDDWSIVIKPLLVIAWVLWGLQLSGPIKEIFREIGEDWRESQSVKIDWEAENKAKNELLQLGNELIAKAEKEKETYSPKDYFNDLRLLREKEAYSFHVFPAQSFVHHVAGNLQQISNRNIDRGLYTMKDVDRESVAFKRWWEERLAVINGREQFDAQVKGITLREFLLFLITLYLRTLPLVAVYYLIRMAQRRGILETILAGKSNFITAVLLFPFFFSKYPFNIIKEIRVEAELRRIKQLFRVLNAKELKTIRQIANSPQYDQWLVNHYRQNQSKFKRGLILALGGTIIFHILLFPSISKVSEKANDSACVVCQAEQGHEQSVDSCSQNNCLAQTQGLVPKVDFIEPPTISSLIVFFKETILDRRLDPIDRIPLSSLFGNSAQTTIQTVLKG